jgi:delta1-piperideine-2-carboxylate reductase
MAKGQIMRDIIHLSFDELSNLLKEIFLAHGCSEPVASALANNCATAEQDGAFSHGIFRIDAYIATLKSGWVNPKAVPQIEDVSAAQIRVDAANGFTLPASAAARPLLIDKARKNGTATLLIRNSHHFSAVWPDVEPFAREGFVAISMVNSMAYVVPHGGRSAVFGTNPIAFAAPRASGDPLVFDLATSAMSHGDTQIAAREGRELPPGIGVDADGNQTTDPNKILNGGALLPFGGHKGSAIAMMIEIMSAALTGGPFSFEVDWSEYEGAATPCTGQFILLIDPSKGNVRPFADRLELLITHMRDAGVERLPGDKRYATRKLALQQGIPIAASELERLRTLAR